MERSAWPKNLSSSGKRAIQELYGQNPKKLRDAFDAHSQTGDDPQQPLSAGDLIVSVLRSISSDSQSLSSGAESDEVSSVPSNACCMSEGSTGSESIEFTVKRVETLVQRSQGQKRDQILTWVFEKLKGTYKLEELGSEKASENECTIV